MQIEVLYFLWYSWESIPDHLFNMSSAEIRNQTEVRLLHYVEGPCHLWDACELHEIADCVEEKESSLEDHLLCCVILCAA